MIADDDDDEVGSISRRLGLLISRNEALGSSILNIESEQAVLHFSDGFLCLW